MPFLVEIPSTEYRSSQSNTRSPINLTTSSELSYNGTDTTTTIPKSLEIIRGELFNLSLLMVIVVIGLWILVFFTIRMKRRIN